MDINETAENYTKSTETAEQISFENTNEAPKQENKLLAMLKSETGEGTIDSYNNHVLNFKNNNNISQILRGFTGMLGCLNFALIDILLGSLSFIKDKNNDVQYVEVEKEKNV